MDDFTLSLASLMQERADKTRALQSLDVEREKLQSQIEAISTILSGIQRYQGNSVAEEPIASALDFIVKKIDEGQSTVAEQAASHHDVVSKNVFDGKKRIRSTEMVAALIVESGHAWSREEAHRGFQERYGIPAAWGNPATALNNALGRAVERGLIRQDGEMFSPVTEVRS